MYKFDFYHHKVYIRDKFIQVDLNIIQLKFYKAMQICTTFILIKQSNINLDNFKMRNYTYHLQENSI